MSSREDLEEIDIKHNDINYKGDSDSDTDNEQHKHVFSPF